MIRLSLADIASSAGNHKMSVAVHQKGRLSLADIASSAGQIVVRDGKGEKPPQSR